MPIKELMIQLNYKCNLNCIHCSYGDIDSTAEAPVERAKAFLRQHPSAELIKLSGGEPTLAANFHTIAALGKATGAKLVCFSNGLGTTDPNVDAYWVSVYGNKEWHAHITRSDQYENAIAFIRHNNVEYLNSPIFSEQQIVSLIQLGDHLGIPLRITRLLPHGIPHETLSLSEQQQIVRKYSLNSEPNHVTCSLGFEPSKCNIKACLKPDGTEIACTAQIRGLKCPFWKT